MTKFGMDRIALRCGMGTILCAYCCSSAAIAQDAAQQFDEIIVTAHKPVDDPTMIASDAASLLATPGDINDPLKALLSLPGITFGGGDLDDPIIRGGGPGDNLFLIDGVPVENVFHELSDSIISPNVIRTFDLHAAAFPPEYGNATGGVIDIGLRDPSATDRRLNIDLSQLKSGLLFETPITDTIAVYGAYRHNLAHLFLKEFERGNDALVFQMPESRDYTGRLIWRRGNTDVTMTAFGSWDKTEDVARDESLANSLGVEQIRQLDAQSLRIRSRLSDRTNFNATLSHSKINQTRRDANGDFLERNANVIAFRGKLSHDAGRHQFTAGVNHQYADNDLSFRGFVPLCDRFEQNCGGPFAAIPTSVNESYQSTELYAGGRIAATNRLTLDLGLHGAIDHFLDETFIEPRIGLSYDINDDLGFYARAGRHHTAPAARDLLIMNNLAGNQESERSTQAMIGQRWNITKGWRLQTEAWFKDFSRTELIGTPLQRTFEGEAYGIDILLAKPISERLYGWAALSLSDGAITDTNTALDVDNQFTPPISATMALTYAFDSGWKVGAKYRIQSGDPFTPLLNVMLDQATGAPLPSFGTPFSERLDNYHRLDIRIEKTAQYGFGDVLYYVDILNVTDRENVANRSFPIPNTLIDPNGATILPNDDEGIPFFIAFGVNFSF